MSIPGTNTPPTVWNKANLLVPGKMYVVVSTFFATDYLRDVGGRTHMWSAGDTFMFIRVLTKKDIKLFPRRPPGTHIIGYYFLVLAEGRLWVLPDNILGETMSLVPALVRRLLDASEQPAEEEEQMT